MPIPSSSRDAITVIAFGSDRSRYMSPVAIIVEGIAIIIDKIVTEIVIDIAIAIIVNAVIANFPWVSPHIVIEFGMGIVHSCINDPNYSIAATSLQIPAFWRINIRIGCTSRLSRIIKPI